MWVKPKQPTGAEKRRKRDGRLTNSDLNRKFIRATAKPKSKPSGAQEAEQPEGPAPGKADEAGEPGEERPVLEETGGVEPGSTTEPGAGSQAFEESFDKEQADSSQLDLIADALCVRLGWGVHDPEI